ncbi:MAG: hypothetical protein KJ709_08665 [Nanoarchaeota archaeon]|nr:hypothetical protein [Nanoarchaeota archaeon]
MVHRKVLRAILRPLGKREGVARHRFNLGYKPPEYPSGLALEFSKLEKRIAERQDAFWWANDRWKKMDFDEYKLKLDKAFVTNERIIRLADSETEAAKKEREQITLKKVPLIEFISRRMPVPPELHSTLESVKEFESNETGLIELFESNVSGLKASAIQIQTKFKKERNRILIVEFGLERHEEDKRTEESIQRCLRGLDKCRREAKSYLEEEKRLLSQYYKSLYNRLEELLKSYRHVLDTYHPKIKVLTFDQELVVNCMPKAMLEELSQRFKKIYDLRDRFAERFEGSKEHVCHRKFEDYPCRERQLEEMGKGSNLLDQVGGRWVTHLTSSEHEYTGSKRVDPLMQMVVNGVVASISYLQDHKIDFATASRRADKNQFNLEGYSLAFSIGVEPQYGDEGVLVQSATLMKQGYKFAVGQSTGQVTTFDEFHLFDPKFSSKGRSPGAAIQITDVHMILPDTSDLNQELFLPAKEGKPIVRDRYTIETKGLWIENNYPQFEDWFTKKVIRYDKSKWGKLISQIRRPAQAGRLAGLLSRMSSRALGSEGKVQGTLMIVDFVTPDSYTYQQDYSGPIFQVLTEKNAIAEAQAFLRYYSNYDTLLKKMEDMERIFTRDLAELEQ